MWGWNESEIPFAMLKITGDARDLDDIGTPIPRNCYIAALRATPTSIEAITQAVEIEIHLTHLLDGILTGLRLRIPILARYARGRNKLEKRA